MKRLVLSLGLTLLSALSLTAYAQANLFSLSFNSLQSSKVLVPLQLPATGPFTLEAWVYPNATTGTYNTILEFGDDAPWFGLTSERILRLYTVVNGTQLPVRTWSHVAYTWDGSTSALYLNGVSIGTSTTAPYRNGASMGIGYNQGDTGWDGRIDEVMIWSTARTPAQLKVDRLAGTAATTAGLLAYFKFDEGSGQVARNQVSGGPAGQLGSTPGPDADDPAWITGTVLRQQQPNALAGEALRPNYPNPVTAQTIIPFTLARTGPVQLRVFDLRGQLVATLLDGVWAAGPHTVAFRPQHLRPGLYLYQLMTTDGTQTHRMTIN